MVWLIIILLSIFIAVVLVCVSLCFRRRRAVSRRREGLEFVESESKSLIVEKKKIPSPLERVIKDLSTSLKESNNNDQKKAAEILSVVTTEFLPRYREHLTIAKGLLVLDTSGKKCSIRHLFSNVKEHDFVSLLKLMQHYQCGQDQALIKQKKQILEELYTLIFNYISEDIIFKKTMYGCFSKKISMSLWC